ncbi:C4-dicarboxylate ABC transporter substrate-binding protein [Sorangium cellulosum]|uniref:C4-dicarboxylate ABC transporter substrate-binding protein n=1 Tax=Sorangium cellulosum TaxID=56 RepID=A0A4P2Q617_SORCE|nr:TAXI family TRAP transporter solute-binding subunit [Sorangium cellulosum]AUX24546.1 C4-dicarboxylate ABC transporter substrate-binding protein [Sorangium cellulosum]
MIRLPFRRQFRREIADSHRRELLRVWAPFLVLGVVALVVTYLLFVEPPPPRRLTIATGQASGRYHAFAEQYRAYLARHGISLEIRETAGSAENVALLLDPASDVSVAFVQGGAMPPEARDRLSSLASVYREPLWIFHRGERPLERLTDLAGKRLSVGPEGSGTRVVALRLLADSGVTAGAQAAAGVPFASLTDPEAAEALLAGRVDAAFFIVGPGSSHVQALIREDGVHLMDLRQHDSFARRYPYLTSVTLSEGLLDLERNIPPAPRPLLAPPAALVASQALHPALIPLLLEAAQAVHEQGNLLDAPGEFPSARFVEAPIHPEARRYLEEGPSFLRRFLPFWAASMVSRLKLMLLPLATVIFSVLKIAQPLYTWRVRARIYRHYEVLHRAQQELSRPVDPARRAELAAKLRELEESLATVSVPLGAMANLYELYLHLGYVRRRLEGEPTASAPPPPPVA